MTDTCKTPAKPHPARQRRFPRRSRRGIGLFGAVLAIVLGAGILLGLLQLYNGANNNTRTQTVLTHIGTGASDIRRTYINQPQFGPTLTKGLLSKMPRSAIQDNPETGGITVKGLDSDDPRHIVTPWGGLIVAGGGNTPRNDGSGTASGNRFYIAVTALPEQPCETIASSFLNDSSVVRVHVAGDGASFSETDTVDAIENACDGGDNDAVAIVFRG